MLTEDFHYELKKNGYPDKTAPFSDDELNSLPPEFPALIIDFYREYGRCTLRKGLLQVCHPLDLRGVLALIFGADKDFNHNEFHAYAFSAFGDIYFWNSKVGGGEIYLLRGELTCIGITDNSKLGKYIENQFYTPFSLDNEGHDIFDISSNALFKRAVKKLGPLEIGECYGFFPALALGGSPELEYLKRVSAPEHFAIVAQTMEFNLIDVQGYGNSVIVRPVG
jgi:hypothetical protein